MASYNLVVLVGNLTRDVELRFTPKGSAVAKIGLAVNRTWKDESGEKKEEVSFIDCEAWGKTAEVIAQYHKKGSSILIQGRLKMDTWEDKQSKEKRSKLKVVVETFSFIGAKVQSESSESEERPPTKTAAPQEDDSVPF